MSDLAGLVSSDSRTPLQKLRRIELYAIADERGIQYPPDHPAAHMLVLLEANGVDPTQPYQGAGIDWQVMSVQQEDGAVRQELYPVHKPAHSAGKDIDYEGEISKRAALALPAEPVADTPKSFSFPLDKMLPWQLNHMCAGIGVDAKGMGKAEMIKVLENGKNAAESGQRSP